MVAKLIKHELKSYIRKVFPVTIVAVALMILAGMMSLTRSENMFILFSAFMIMFSVYSALIIMVVTVAKRFKTSLFAGEGYMTFSIPASSTQLIVAKLISAFILWIYMLAIMLISIMLLYVMYIPIIPEQYVNEYISIFKEEFNFALGEVNALIIIEQAVLALVGLVNNILFIFLCICIGQLFKNRKTLFSVLFFVAFMIISSLIQVPYSSLLYMLADISIHLAYIVELIVCVGITAAYFFFVKYIITHKLNIVV